MPANLAKLPPVAVKIHVSKNDGLHSILPEFQIASVTRFCDGTWILNSCIDVLSIHMHYVQYTQLKVSIMRLQTCFVSLINHTCSRLVTMWADDS
mgnify:CR=1 FL=1